MKSEGSDKLLSEQRENRNASDLAYRRESSSVNGGSKGQVKRKVEEEEAVLSRF